MTPLSSRTPGLVYSKSPIGKCSSSINLGTPIGPTSNKDDDLKPRCTFVEAEPSDMKALYDKIEKYLKRLFVPDFGLQQRHAHHGCMVVMDQFAIHLPSHYSPDDSLWSLFDDFAEEGMGVKPLRFIHI